MGSQVQKAKIWDALACREKLSGARHLSTPDPMAARWSHGTNVWICGGSNSVATTTNTRRKRCDEQADEEMRPGTSTDAKEKKQIINRWKED